MKAKRREPVVRLTLPFSGRLGAKLIAASATLLLIMAVLTAWLLARGFEAARENALVRARVGLEGQARSSLAQLASSEARLTWASLEPAATLSRVGARTLGKMMTGEAERSALPALTRLEGGQRYDANPERISEIFVPSFVKDSPLLERELRDSALLEPLFPGLLAQLDDAVSVYYVGTTGVTRYYPVRGIHLTVPAGLDVRTQEHYLNAMPARNPGIATVWTSPYQDDAGNGLLVTAATPVLVGSEFRGILAVDVSLARIASRLDEVRPTNGGWAFLVDEDTHLVAAPGDHLGELLGKNAPRDPQVRPHLSLIDSGDAALLPVLHAMQAGDPGLKQVRLGGHDYFVSYSPLGRPGVSAGWNLALVAPIAEVTAPARSLADGIERDASGTLGATILLMGFVFLGGLLALGVFSQQALVRPIAGMVAATRAMAGGDLTARAPAGARDELGVLARSLNDMAEQLSQRAEALRESEERFDLAIRGSNDAIWDWDIAGNHSYTSSRFKEMLGYADDELEGTIEHWPELIHPDDRERVLATVDEHLAGHGGLLEFEHRLRHKDGSYRHVLARGMVLRDSDYRPLRAAGSYSDITDRALAYQELEARVQSRTAELVGLLSTFRDLASTLELRPLLGLLLSKLRDLVTYDAAAILALEDDTHLSLLSYQGPPLAKGAGELLTLERFPHFRAVVAGRHPIIIPDTSADEPLAKAVRASSLRQERTTTGSWMGVPLVLRDRVIGLLAVTHGTVGQYTVQRAELAQAFALQAGIAIENARLFEAAQDKAALEERQKLARELHDSVSQALYGIALGARTARSVIERDPSRAVPPIDYVLNLAEAGLAEMRALIFELRPESLEQEGLAAALSKHAAALHARHGLDVKLALCAEPQLALSVKQDLYRIAQEALHNVVKHAQAKRVELSLRCEEGAVVLEVKDDGVGFDSDREYAGHLGQRSMRERAAGLGADLKVTSVPNNGTLVSLRLPVRAAATAQS